MTDPLRKPSRFQIQRLEERIAPSLGVQLTPTTVAVAGAAALVGGSLCWAALGQDPSDKRRSWQRFRPLVEGLECRLTPATFNVNSLADILTPPPGIVTLRSAIQQANANPGADTINLTVGGTYTIGIIGSANNNNTTGDFDILPTGGNLTIQNTSGRAVTVHGPTSNAPGAGDRVFDIAPDFDPAHPSAAFSVTMSGFTVTGGHVNVGDHAGDSGGGIRVKGNASLTLNNMTITGNIAPADGGGVAVEESASFPWTLALNNTTISNNRAGDAGGGIDTDGSGTVVVSPGSVISGNTAVNQGAGIWLDAIQSGTTFQSANLTVNGALIRGNRALSTGGIGGGIGNAGNGVVAITRSTLANNFAGASGGGFGDENGQGTLFVTASTFLHNTAAGNGGGIAAGGPSTSITYSEIDGNASGGSGGGLFANGRTLSLRNSTLANNTSAGNGGGIELATTGAGLFFGSTIVNTTLFNNAAVNNGGAVGGGIDIGLGSSGDLLLLNDTIDGNSASVGGGLYWAGGGNVGVANTIIAGNFAPVAPDVSVNRLFTAALNGAQQVPPTVTPGTGTASLVFNPDLSTVTVSLSSTGLLGTITAQHLHVGAAGTNGSVALDANGAPIELGTANPTTGTFTVDNLTTHNPGGFISALQAGNIYTNIHSSAFPNGEIRGQFTPAAGSFTDLGGNVIGVGGPGSGNNGAFTDPRTQQGSVFGPLDPLLDVLTFNGGPTLGAPSQPFFLQTQLLLPGSPAIGTGNILRAPLSDERGAPSFNSSGKVNAGATSGPP